MLKLFKDDGDVKHSSGGLLALVSAWIGNTQCVYLF